jgi:hypothetical protein
MKEPKSTVLFKTIHASIHENHESSSFRILDFNQEKRKLKTSLKYFLINNRVWRSYGVQTQFNFYDNEVNYIDQLLRCKAHSFCKFITSLSKTSDYELVYQALVEIDDEKLLQRELFISLETLMGILLHSNRKS